MRGTQLKSFYSVSKHILNISVRNSQCMYVSMCHCVSVCICVCQCASLCVYVSCVCQCVCDLAPVHLASSSPLIKSSSLRPVRLVLCLGLYVCSSAQRACMAASLSSSEGLRTACSVLQIQVIADALATFCTVCCLISYHNLVFSFYHPLFFYLSV